MYNAIMYSRTPYPDFINHHLKQKIQEIPMLYQYIREEWYNQYPLPE